VTITRLNLWLAAVFGLVGPIALGFSLDYKPGEIWGFLSVWLVMNIWLLAPCTVLAVVAWKAKSPIVIVGNLVLTFIVGLMGAWMYLMPKEAGMIVGSEGNWSVILVPPRQYGLILVGEICLHAFNDFWVGRKK
jgi:hypothetical protein